MAAHGRDQVRRALRGALLGGEVEQPLQRRDADQRAAQLVGPGPLGQPVDRAEPVEQRTGLEVRRPAQGDSDGRDGCSAAVSGASSAVPGSAAAVVSVAWMSAVVSTVMATG